MVLKDVFNEVTATVLNYEQQEIKQYEESLKQDADADSNKNKTVEK